MGDEITLLDVLYIQNGIIQFNFKNERTNKIDTCFCNAQEFFKMLGDSMQKNHIELMISQGWEPNNDQEDQS